MPSGVLPTVKVERTVRSARSITETRSSLGSGARVEFEHGLRRGARHPECRAVAADARIVRLAAIGELEGGAHAARFQIDHRDRVARLALRSRAGDGDEGGGGVARYGDFVRALAGGQQRLRLAASRIDERNFVLPSERHQQRAARGCALRVREGCTGERGEQPCEDEVSIFHGSLMRLQ